MQLCQLLYASRAARPMTSDELNALGAAASEYNEANQISGILVYSKQRFIQVLEGPPDQIAELFASIERDPRHTEVRPLTAHLVGARAFSGWSMKVFDCDRRPDLDSSLFEDRLFVEGEQEWDGSDAARAMRLLLEFARRGPAKASAA